jgi:hypothetical protein
MKRATGHINFRLKPETHGQLLEVADGLGTDLTSILNQMITEALPAYLVKAAGVARRRLDAGTELVLTTVLGLVLMDPLVRLAVEAGRPLHGKKRIEAMTAAVAPAVQEGGPTLEDILTAALYELGRGDAAEAARQWQHGEGGVTGEGQEGRQPAKGGMTSEQALEFAKLVAQISPGSKAAPGVVELLKALLRTLEPGVAAAPESRPAPITGKEKRLVSRMRPRQGAQSG